MKKIIALLFILVLSSQAYAQDFGGYSNDKLKFESEYLQDSVLLNIHLPETFNFSGDITTYPITIIFDSQHERTYPQIINAIDLLTNESQIPETVIVGVPFNFSNRYYLTSSKKYENDALSGIEKMEKFLFDELIPMLQKDYKTNDFISVMGHSRTAFLVNYLTTKHSDQLDIAVALSGFYSNQPISMEGFKTFISDPSHFPNPFNYYYTAGNTLEDQTYLVECQELHQFTSNNELPTNFEAHFIEPLRANHITNYWVSVPPILIDAFSDYNFLLNNWFHEKLKRDSILNAVEEFKSDLDYAGSKIGFEVNPSLTQIFSLASSFAYERNDYEAAIDFIKLGQKYFPDYTDFDLALVEFYRELKDLNMSQFYESEYRRKIKSRTDLSESEKTEFLQYLEE